MKNNIVLSRNEFRILAVLQFWLLCSPAIAIQFLHIDATGYIPIILSFIFIFYTFTRTECRKIITNPIICWWSVLMIYHMIHNYILGIPDENHWRLDFLKEILLMYFIALMYISDTKKTIWSILISYIYILFVAYLHPSNEFDRFSSEIIYVTQLGQLCGLACLMISILFYLNNKSKWILLLYIFPIAIMLLTQSRNGMLLVVFAYISLFISKINIRNFPKILLMILLIYFAYDTFKGTEFFQRFVSTGDNEIMYATNTFLDDIFGERVIYYALGYLNFQDHPIFGIGLLNFLHYNNFEYPIHAEFWTHFVEGGVIGGLLFICFYYYMFKNLFKGIKHSDTLQRQHLINLFAFVALGFTARIFHIPMFFPVYGLILGFIIKKNKYENCI
jgi:hypothetical protein